MLFCYVGQLHTAHTVTLNLYTVHVSCSINGLQQPEKYNFYLYWRLILNVLTDDSSYPD